MRPLESSLTTQLRSFLIQMATTSTIWSVGRVTDKTSVSNTLCQNTQKNTKRRSLFFSISEAILRETVQIRLISRLQLQRMVLPNQEWYKMWSMSRNGWEQDMPSCSDSLIKLFKSTSRITLRSCSVARLRLWLT
jgi:hypothetical protein